MHMHLQQTESCLSAPPAATPPPRDQWDLQPNRTQHQNWRLASRDRCQNPHGRPYIFKTVCEIRTAFTTTANRHSVRAGPHPLPVISETELHLTDTGTIKVLVAKDFSHELLGSDTISQGQGKIDFARRELTCFGKSFQITPYTDSLPATVLVHAAVVTTW